MKNFITNAEDKELKNRLIELIKNSEEMKFLVGFFYFSGIQEIYQGLKNNTEVVLKILVGMNIDNSNFRLLEYADEDHEASDAEKSDKYLGDIRKSLTSEDFDTPSFYEQVSYFVQMIKDGRLIIRKTQEPNHAKIYFFHDHDNPMKKKLFITGSSNLTRPALTTQAEFNVEISDYGAQETEEYYDALWDDAVKISENDEIKQRLISVIEKGTLVRDVTPYEAYVLSLKTYIESFKQENIGQSLIDVLKRNGYTPYQYQLDAVKQALAIINENNGVIIADVVGLGKTIIACSVARELRRRGIVLSPPGLIGDRNKKSGWLMYLEQFGLADWEVRSVGDLEKTAEFVQGIDDIEVVIIDEVHRFRNQDTKDYEFLKNICRNKIVILLTATPFNNRPSDILALLKLFITPKKSSITLENNLISKFRVYKTIFDHLSYISRYWKSTDPVKRDKAKNYYLAIFGEIDIDLTKVKQRAKLLAANIRDVIEPVTIRRNRLDLQNNPFYREEVKHLSKIADPIEWFFELTPEQSTLYDKIVTEYFGSFDEGGKFIGAIYRPFEYETAKDEGFEEKENFEFVQQRELYSFMRRLMVKRFESSFGAFEQSIRRFKRITKNALEFIRKTNKYILDRSLLEKIYSLDEDTIEEYLEMYAEEIQKGIFPKNNRIYNLSKFAFANEFIHDIESDLELFDKIIEELDQMDLVSDDPKSKCLVEHVKHTIDQNPNHGEPKRKVVIFSEYLDTVKHLEKSLKDIFHDRILVVGGTLTSKMIETINKNFDASYHGQHDDFDVLLSTDRLSEGFNLNRAGMVINYDIPWNPVRVIQRVGRINRISKKVFDDLFIVNFFPTEKGSELVKSREIASAKMYLIHEILGEDSKIFDIDETPTPAGLFTRITQNPDELEEESFFTKVLNRYVAIQKENPALIEELEEFPPRVKVSKNGSENELLVFFKKGRLYIQAVSYDAEDDKPNPLTFEQALPKIECDVRQGKLSLSENFWKQYKNAKEIKEDRDGRTSPRSVETQAINNLKTLLKKDYLDITHHRHFIQTLLIDILDYGTLSDFTLRRISNLETLNKSKLNKLDKELSSLKRELGDDYLNKEINRLKKTRKEIIIAIENQKL
jgi:superfamily II DNA or RNA helicase/HKD family nuclease